MPKEEIDYDAIARQHGGSDTPLTVKSTRRRGPPVPITNLPGNIVSSTGAFGGQLWKPLKAWFSTRKENLLSYESATNAHGYGESGLGTANKFGPGHIGPHPMTEYPEAVGALLREPLRKRG